MRYWLNMMFAALWGADAGLTIMFVGLHGFEAEVNPLMRWVLETCGIRGFLLVKAVTLIFWLVMQERLKHLWVHWALVVLMIPVVIAGFVGV